MLSGAAPGVVPLREHFPVRHGPLAAILRRIRRIWLQRPAAYCLLLCAIFLRSPAACTAAAAAFAAIAAAAASAVGAVATAFVAWPLAGRHDAEGVPGTQVHARQLWIRWRRTRLLRPGMRACVGSNMADLGPCMAASKVLRASCQQWRGAHGARRRHRCCRCTAGAKLAQKRDSRKRGTLAAHRGANSQILLLLPWHLARAV